MLTFSLNEYRQKNKNTKVKVFIEFIYEKFKVSPDVQDFDNTYFSLFNEDDLIESLEYYIRKNKVTAKVTAANYITYMSEFFGMLSKQYDIKNDIFVNIEENKKFATKSKEIISKLKETVSKEYASDDQYQELLSGIEEFMSVVNENEIYEEMNKFFNREIKNVKLYHRFISIIAIKLVIRFAINNLSLISLHIKKLNLENGTLDINGFELPLDEELIQLFKTYLKMREVILNRNSKLEELLFIKPNGEPYIKKLSHRENAQDYASFFKIMKDKIGTQSAELFAKRRILEMFESGIDIYTVSQISEISIEKCIEIQNNNNREDDVRKKLDLFFKNDLQIRKSINVKRKGFINCPFCGEEAKAISDEWVLVQFKDDSKKYLACISCRGEYGQRNI